MEDKRRKRGRPVNHPRVVNPNTGKTYDTFTEAGADCGGTRWGVMRACEGYQRHHRGIKFRYEEDDKNREHIAKAIELAVKSNIKARKVKYK